MALLRAFQSEQELSKARNGLIDLNILWAACGKHRKSTPRVYVEKENRLYDSGIEVTEGPNGECFVEYPGALGYALEVNEAFAKILMGGLNEALSSRPGRSMLQCPSDPFMSLAATAAVMSTEKVSPEEAQRRIIKDAVAESDDLDAYAQETKIAEVQRALGSIKFVDIS